MKKDQRHIAEWVTIIISIAIVGGLAIFLVIGALQPRSDFIALQTRIVSKDVVRRGDNYLLPIELVNNSRESVRSTNIELSFDDENRQRTTRDIAFNYVAAGATQRSFVAFDRDPRGLKVQAQLSWYQVH